MPQFRAKARAVDLLGKGQISDLPTAISELWKNGYDAYGDTLEAFIYLEGYENIKTPLFILQDDAKGMSRKDILEKWIVLGTDSKTRNEFDIKGEETLWKEPRIKMGEKGIGRLSVAYLGSPMLMLTKKKDEPLQLLYFDWRTLENYNLFLEDVNIPLKSVISLTEFKKVFKEIQLDFLKNFQLKKDFIDNKEVLIDFWSEQLSLKESIVNDTQNIVLHDFLIDDFVQPLLSSESHGTTFIIFNPDQQLLALAKDADKKEDLEPEYRDSINELRSGLNGLFNVFKHEIQTIKTNFYIVSESGKYDFISSREFFAWDDFDNAEHVIDGIFDENGFFNGKVRVFNEPLDYSFRANRKPGKTPYGSFSLKLGYVSGEKLNFRGEEISTNLNTKIETFGGLYIYRDGFRVLPYGRPNADFLSFEERRSKNAGIHFFSYRRMFGYIEISRKNNARLTDKAGREGFINNIAYREFRNDLIEMFADLARKYFSTYAKTNYKEDQQSEIKKAKEIEKVEKGREKDERKKFIKQLIECPKQLKILETELGDLYLQLNDKYNQADLVYEDLDILLKRIADCKQRIKKQALKKPVRFLLSENQEKKFYDYQVVFDKLQENKIAKGDELVLKTREKLQDYELLKNLESRYKQCKNYLSNMLEGYNDRVGIAANNLKDIIHNEKKRILINFQNEYEHIKPTTTNREAITTSLMRIETHFEEIKEKEEERIGSFLKHIENLSLEIDEDILTGFYKLQYEEIVKKWNQTKELAQLGITVEIIDHQFNALYSQVALSIKEIKQYIGTYDKGLREYQSLKTSFEHLENKYKLMSPLYRTTGKVRKEISGIYIYDYLSFFFKSILKERKIIFTISESFSASLFFYI